VKLTDAEAIEAQVVENLQREDIHPLEEALGFRSLLELKDGTYTVNTYDEAGLCKLLLEISLLDSAYQRSTANGDDVLMSAAKRYRVEAEKLQKAVAGELAAKLAKTVKDKSTVRSKNEA
jgi:hypothetical protein